jgi:4-hydroxy-3-methylbut-2-enyl diphosphate reductase
MRVKLAKTAGFCMGVRRAMNAVLEAANRPEGSLSTLGPLVHNRQAMEMLATRRVKVVSSPGEAECGTLFIRAHGVTPEVRRSAERPGLEVRDMTCPHVRRAQIAVERHADRGYHSIIIGDAGHAEVVGLLGHARGRGFVVGSEEEIETLPPDLEKVCVVAQTTQNARRFHELAPLVEARYPGAVVHDTVCSATDDRQNEVRRLAREVGAVIVVGGRHSANTVRLAEIAREEGATTLHVETAEELDAEELARFRSVGITAGASTPHWVFRAVVEKARYCLEARSALTRFLRAAVGFGVHGYLYVGAGSAGVTYAALRLLGLRPRFSYLLVACLYVVSMHLLNRFTDRDAARMNDPQRMRLLERFPGVLAGAAFLLATLSLVIAAGFGLYPFLLMFLSLAAGIGYNLPLIPRWVTRRVRVTRVREIPGSKNLFMALAWALVTVLVPCLATGSGPLLPAALVFAFVFLMVLIRSLVFDRKDLEGDRILGKETLPLVLGPRATGRLVLLCALALALIALSDLYPGWSALDGLLLLPVVSWVGVYLLLDHRIFLTRGVLFEIVVDAQFVGMGLLAYAIPYASV